MSDKPYKSFGRQFDAAAAAAAKRIALAESACSGRPIPKALYPCLYCYEDHTWPANDLYWSEQDQGWVCVNCWSDDDMRNTDGVETRGPSLADEIEAQNA